jgi:hypothetical protein
MQTNMSGASPKLESRPLDNLLTSAQEAITIFIRNNSSVNVIDSLLYSKKYNSVVAITTDGNTFQVHDVTDPQDSKKFIANKNIGIYPFEVYLDMPEALIYDCKSYFDQFNQRVGISNSNDPGCLQGQRFEATLQGRSVNFITIHLNNCFTIS